MSDSIDCIGAFAYRENPDDTTTVAVARVEMLIDARDTVIRIRRNRPDAFPGPVWADASPAAGAAKIVAALLDLGWSPPSTDDVATAVARLGTGYYDGNGDAR